MDNNRVAIRPEAPLQQLCPPPGHIAVCLFITWEPPLEIALKVISGLSGDVWKWDLPGTTPRSLNLHDRAPQCQPGGDSQSNPCITGIKWRGLVSVGFLRTFWQKSSISEMVTTLLSSSSIQCLFKIQTVENVFWQNGSAPSRETTLSCAALLGTMNLELSAIKIYWSDRLLDSTKQKIK